VSWALLLTLLALSLGGCAAEAGDAPPAPPPKPRPVSSVELPPELRRLHERANVLVDGGPAAFERQLRDLRGHPVVVNKWASWCGPCRSEFPVFDRVSRDLAGEVAFLGVNAQDDPDAARRFLRENPVGFPHYVDPDQEVAKLFRGNAGFPTTAFYDARGRFKIALQKSYRTPAELRRAIVRYTR
jgi:cytochrome c biogenesis protein CcmG/thiol:disulfide interchange protein DsbE